MYDIRMEHVTGVYAIAFATTVCQSKDPTLIEFDHPKICHHLVQCLNKGNTEFPSRSEKLEGYKSEGQECYKTVYCHCLQLET